MQVGIFSSSLPEPGRKPGGVDVFVDQLASRLVGRGHDVRVFTYSEAPAEAPYACARLRPSSYAHAKLARMTAVPLALNRLDTFGLDVLHLHGDDWFFVSRKVPTVRTFHGSARHEARTATAIKRRLGQTATFGLEMVASRLATASYMGAPPEERAYRLAGTLPYAVDVPGEGDLSRSGPPMVLFVGTWSGRKRGRLLYECFQREVLPALPDAQLHMVSDFCPGGASTVWWDRPDRRQLNELYQRAWVFCLPSSYEGFGLPYVEAMAVGTPVIATRNPGAEHVLGYGRYGWIVNDEELGLKLRALLVDETRRRALAEAGRRRAHDFSWDAALDAHERAYRLAIGRWEQRRGRTSGRAGRFPLGWRAPAAGAEMMLRK